MAWYQRVMLLLGMCSMKPTYSYSCRNNQHVTVEREILCVRVCWGHADRRSLDNCFEAKRCAEGARTMFAEKQVVVNFGGEISPWQRCDLYLSHAFSCSYDEWNWQVWAGETWCTDYIGVHKKTCESFKMKFPSSKYTPPLADELLLCPLDFALEVCWMEKSLLEMQSRKVFGLIVIVLI